jgi:hypothetical protein
VFSHLYFSCTNYQQLAQARITKVVGHFTTNPKKLVLYFSEFSVIFYTIYKNQQTHFTILVALLQGGPRKDLCFCNVAPGGPGSGGPAKFRRAAAELGQGRAWGGARGHWGAIWGLGRGRERAGEGRRRRPGLVAAAACRAGEEGVWGEMARRRVRLRAREGGKSVYLDFQPAGPGAHRGCHPWHRRRLGPGHGAGEGRCPFYGRPGSLQATTRDPR